MKSQLKDDFSHFHSTSGMATKSWGPSGWCFLFTCILGAYPVKLNKNNKEHQKIKTHFKQMLKSLAFTMPCVYCRNSFQQFYKELPIDTYLVGRIELMYWLYLIRDKVNNKLIQQEKKCYNTEKKRLKRAFKQRKITEAQYYDTLENLKIKILITRPSPPFLNVLEKYEKYRAVCSEKSKTCSLPKSITRK